MINYDMTVTNYNDM